MPPKAQKAAAAGRLVGYARVSTEEQGTDPQTDELRAAGCTAIREEHASGADRSRPVLTRLLRDITAGDTLVVVRLDRLARSVSHLLVVIEQLAAKGTYFCSLRDPIDTTTPQGMFSLQVLGAVAQLERALIAERTKAGLLAARKHGRVGGNPGLRARDPAVIRKVQNSRDKTWLDRVLAQLDTWLPTVQRLRPALGRRRAGVEPEAGHDLDDLDGRATAPHGAAPGRGGHRRGQFAGPRSAAARRGSAGPPGRRH
jgi:DNA invertase Pin-like site-specific DNA recombinase